MIACVRLAGLHFFVDLGIVSRLLPLAMALPAPEAPLHGTATPTRPTTAPRMTAHNILASLDPEAPAVDPVPRLEVTWDIIRVEVRCPPPSVLRQATSFAPVRSGILFVDLFDGVVQSSEKETTSFSFDRLSVGLQRPQRE